MFSFNTLMISSAIAYIYGCVLVSLSQFAVLLKLGHQSQNLL